MLVKMRKGMNRRDSDWPFSNTALAVVEQRKSWLNSVRQADGSLLPRLAFSTLLGLEDVNRERQQRGRSPRFAHSMWRSPRKMLESGV